MTHRFPFAATLGVTLGLTLTTATQAQVAVQRGLASPQSLSNAFVPVAFATTDVNTSAAAVPAATIGVAETAGLFDVGGALTVASLSSGTHVDGYVAVNGVPRDRFYQGYDSGGAWEEIGFSSLVQLNAGDVVTLHASVQGAGGQISASDFTKASLVRRRPGNAAVQRFTSAVQSINTSFQPVDFASTDINVGGVATPGSAIGTAPRDGLYDVSGAVTATAFSSGTAIDGYVAVNGVLRDRFYQGFGAGGLWEEIGFSGLLQLNAGDVVTVQTRTAFGTGMVGANGNTRASLSELTPQVAVQRGMASTQTLTGAYEPVAFATTDVNVGGVATASGVLGIAPVAGVYDVSGALTAINFAGGTAVEGFVAVNGVPRDRFFQGYGIGGVWEEISFDTLLSLNPGDVVAVYARVQGGSGQIAGSEFTRADFVLVPEPATLASVAGAAALLLGRRRRVRVDSPSRR